MTTSESRVRVDDASTPAAPDRTGRVDAVRAAMNEAQVASLVVSDPSNIRWLSGFTGSNGVVVVTHDRMVLCTDGRYASQGPDQMERHGTVADTVIGPDLVASAAGLFGDGRVGLEADHISWAMHERFAEVVDVALVATSGLVGRLRAVKEPDEAEAMRRAAALADEALAAVVPMLLREPTERAVGLALDDHFRQAGAGPAYETIVASGPNAALPHARPTDRVIARGDLVIIDVGSCRDGYRSDMTRTFVIGPPDDTQVRMLDVVARSQAAGVATVVAGVAAKAVDEACRSVIDEAGWGDRFVHGTGHGVGIDIHEQPWLNARSADVLDVSMAVTVEPGVYLEGFGGVRWEDLVLVTDDGCEVLSASPKEPDPAEW